jgi:hypothetical protein
MPEDISIEVTPSGQVFVTGREVRAIDVSDGTIERDTMGVARLGSDGSVITTGLTVTKKTTY